MIGRALTSPLRLAGRVLIMEPSLAALFLAAGAATLAMTAWKAIGPLTASDVCLLAAALALLPRFTLQRLRAFAVPLAAVALIMAGGLLGTWFSPDPGSSLAELAKLGIVTGGAMLLIVLWGPSPLQARRFVWLWVLSGALSAAVAIAVPDLHNFIRPSGLTPHPNHLGLLSVLLLPAAIVLAHASRGMPGVAGWAFSALLAAAIVLSGSRAAAGAAVAVVAVLLVALRSRIVTLVFAGIAAAGLALAASGAVSLGDQNVLDRLFGGDDSVTRSEVARDDYNQEAIDRLESHPLTGAGFDEAERAHSIYLQVGSAAGILGLLGLGAIVAFTVLVLLRGVLRRGPPPADRERLLLVALAAGFGGFLAAGAFFNVLVDRNAWLALALFTSLAAAFGIGGLRQRPQPVGEPATAAP